MWYQRLLPKLGVVVESLSQTGTTLEFTYPSVVILIGGDASASDVDLVNRLTVFGPGTYHFRSRTPSAVIGYATVESKRIRVL